MGSDPTSPVMVLRLIAMAMLTQPPIFLGVSYLVSSESLPDPMGALVNALAGAAVGTAVAGFLVLGRGIAQLQGGRPPGVAAPAHQPPPGMSTCIIALALLEAPSVLALVAHFVGAPRPTTFPLFVLGMGGLVYGFLKLPKA